MKHASRLAFLTLLLGCKGQTSDTDTATDTDTDVELDCSTLDVASCDLEAACTATLGAPIVPGNEGIPSCTEDSEALGCRSVDVSCDTAITRAADPSDTSTCYQFTDGCLPPGWVACDPDPGEALEQCSVK